MLLHFETRGTTLRRDGGVLYTGVAEKDSTHTGCEGTLVSSGRTSVFRCDRASCPQRGQRVEYARDEVCLVHTWPARLPRGAA